MAKKDTDVKFGSFVQAPPKKSLLSKIFNSKKETKEVQTYIKKNKINQFLFYTSVDNILLILQNGIRLIKNQLLEKGEEYFVWTYLEHENSIGLEYDNSTRAQFWNWANEANINVEEIAVIGINSERLLSSLKKDIAYDKVTNFVYVYEDISLETIDYIMIKDKVNLKRIKTFVTANEIPIKIFFGENGNIEELNGDKK